MPARIVTTAPAIAQLRPGMLSRLPNVKRREKPVINQPAPTQTPSTARLPSPSRKQRMPRMNERTPAMTLRRRKLPDMRGVERPTTHSEIPLTTRKIPKKTPTMRRVARARP
jgi:hypothetical protein